MLMDTLLYVARLSIPGIPHAVSGSMEIRVHLKSRLHTYMHDWQRPMQSYSWPDWWWHSAVSPIHSIYSCHYLSITILFSPMPMCIIIMLPDNFTPSILQGEPESQATCKHPCPKVNITGWLLLRGMMYHYACSPMLFTIGNSMHTVMN